MQTRNGLELPRNTSLVPGARAESLNAESVMQPRREKTLKGGRMSTNKHSVFVLSKDGKALTPTTPTKARKLLTSGAAVKSWSKFGTFGIQLTIDSRIETPDAALGVDNGTKFEGYSVVVGVENPINVKLDLPNKKLIVKKIDERRALRQARRWRNCRRRPARFDNRRRQNWLAPSQAVIVGSRLKVIRECFRIYPINYVAFEDVRFNHAKHRWGANFSTVEIGKTRLRDYFKSHGAVVFEYRGFETKEFREKYGYKKTRVKNADKFTAHCSDSLALAVNVIVGARVEPGLFIVVNDIYRYVRRKLHYTQPIKGGIRTNRTNRLNSKLHRGLLIGLPNGKMGRLCGEYPNGGRRGKGGYRYYNINNKRASSSQIVWTSSDFFTRR